MAMPPKNTRADESRRTMNGTELMNMISAIRMTCSDPTLDGKKQLPVITSFFDTAEAVEFSSKPRDYQEFARMLGMGPVFGFGSSVQPHEVATTLASGIQMTDETPSAVVIENTGVFTIARTRDEALRRYRTIIKSAPLAAEQKKRCGCARLSGKIAVVTGSAQGFGRGIAEELVENGAHVVISDLNEEGARECATQINEKFGAETAIACRADVSDGAAVNALLECAFKAFGGVDIFVSNAGVLKAGSLEELDERAFDLVTTVNYKAFFLCTKAASAAMKIQNKYNGGYFADIVQINSKSGLEGSNKNFAYAGSKFGSIGLVQSFALELIPHRIKVNAICPGNYYEGPLWSDPENGLFVQYLRAGKVPGAKTIEDIREFYVGKVPMHRGCSPKDVTRAIMYAHEQEYETGQAIPVTGGQVMLN